VGRCAGAGIRRPPGFLALPGVDDAVTLVPRRGRSGMEQQPLPERPVVWGDLPFPKVRCQNSRRDEPTRVVAP